MLNFEKLFFPDGAEYIRLCILKCRVRILKQVQVASAAFLSAI